MGFVSFHLTLARPSHWPYSIWMNYLVVLCFVIFMPVDALATTKQELMDPNHWKEMQRQANGVGASGKHIKVRALACVEEENVIHEAFARSAYKVWDFSYNKPGGFMAMNDILAFERKLRNASEYGYYLIRKTMHSGASESACAAHRVEAIDTINCLMAILPKFSPRPNGTPFRQVDCKWQLDTSRP